jgi:membrane associated rhomboid family serine protease
MAVIPTAWWRRVRELPFVSLGLAALVLVTFLVIQAGYSARLDMAHLEVSEAVGYAIENPVVEIPERLLPAIRAVLPTFESNEMFSFLKQADAGKGGTSHQARFDERVQGALARLDSHPYRALGVVPARPRVSDFATHAFVHPSGIQLVLVVVLLLVFGPLMERTWGHGIFAGAVVVIAVASAGVFSLVHPGGDRPLLGAGPLLVALSVALATRYPRGRVDALEWLSPLASIQIRLPSFRLPGWALAGLGAVGVALATAAAPGSLPDGLDAAYGIAALVSGVALGVLAALALARSGLEDRFGEALSLETSDRPARSARFDYGEVMALRAAGAADEAFERLAVEVERSARNRDAVMAFFEMAVEREEVDRAVPVMQQLVHEEMRRGAVEVAVSHWRSLAENAPGARLEPPLLLRLIPAIRDEDGDEHAVLAVQQVLAVGGAGLTTPQLVDLARQTNEFDPDAALEAARIALEAEDLRREHRREMEDLVERRAEKEDAIPVIAPRKLPANPFYEEQDRSVFAEAGGDLGEITDPAHLESLGHPVVADALRVTHARPLGLDAETVSIDVEGRGATRLPMASVLCIGSVGVRGLGPRPVVITDLVIAGPPGEGPAALQVVRFRSDRYDPRRLVPKADSALVALQTFVSEVGRRASATALVPADRVGSGPIAMFASLEAYESELLRPAVARRTGVGS